MPALTIRGNDPTAHILRLACEENGLDAVTQIRGDYAPTIPAAILPANISKIITALIPEQGLKELSTLPDRKHIRLAKSGYLISEIPLGKFYSDRYGAKLYNIKENELNDLLKSSLTSSTISQTSHNEHNSNILAVTDLPAAQLKKTNKYHTFYAEIPIDKKSFLINTTWIGKKQLAHQFCTSKSSHLVFLSQSEKPLDPNDWHPSIREAAESARKRQAVPRIEATDDLTTIDGSIVKLGLAWSEDNWLLPESVHVGLEDAWVLSRMLESYEEDIDNAISYYEKYRKVRLARLRRMNDEEFTKCFETKGVGRLGQHIGLAFSTRFIPEIYMNRQDWLHGYDCLRGFR